jgi:hypothetical protein
MVRLGLCDYKKRQLLTDRKPFRGRVNEKANNHEQT